MIRSIPNKFDQKMLLNLINEKHKFRYDFVYLPMDFKNKCNLGYAFLNLIHPMFILPFYKDFNGQKWKCYNSEKVCQIAYARIQSKAGLIEHFQCSNIMSHTVSLFNRIVKWNPSFCRHMLQALIWFTKLWRYWIYQLYECKLFPKAGTYLKLKKDDQSK